MLVLCKFQITQNYIQLGKCPELKMEARRVGKNIIAKLKTWVKEEQNIIFY